MTKTSNAKKLVGLSRLRESRLAAFRLLAVSRKPLSFIKLAIAFSFVGGLSPLISNASAQEFVVTSVPDDFTSILTDTADASRTITVTLEPQDTDCAAFDAAGAASVSARDSAAACDRTIALNFQTSGFALESISFNDLDDFDGGGARDSFAASVPGTWTSPTIEIHSFATPPAFADEASRLTDSGAVGTFLANAFGESNPTDETAAFTLTNPVSSFIIYFDDVDGRRNARGGFNLATLSASIEPNVDNAIVAVDDTETGVDGLNGEANVLNVLTDDMLDGAAATLSTVTISVATGSTVPTELTFDPATGIVGVAAGTLAGPYSFDYQICEVLNPANCDTATATVDVAAAPLLEMTKVADDAELVTAGQEITYTYTITNTGNVAINGVEVADVHNGAGPAPTVAGEALLTDNGTAGDSTDATADDGVWDVLAPGDVVTFVGTYFVQQADIDNLQ